MTAAINSLLLRDPASTEIYTLSHTTLFRSFCRHSWPRREPPDGRDRQKRQAEDRKSTRLNSSHRCISYAVFCLKKKINNVFRKFRAFHDETGRLNVDGINIISNERRTQQNR